MLGCHCNARDVTAGKMGRNSSNNNNINKSIYIAPWLQVTLFKGAVTSKKPSKNAKGKDIKIYNIKNIKT